MDIIITAFCYLAVPLCVGLICWGFEKELTKRSLWAIVAGNGAVVWLIFQVIAIEQGQQGTGAAVLLYSAIAYWLLKRHLRDEP